MDGCLQSARCRSSCLQSIRKVARKINVAEFFQSQAAQKSKNSYFIKRALCVSLPFGLKVSFIFGKFSAGSYDSDLNYNYLL